MRFFSIFPKQFRSFSATTIDLDKVRALLRQPMLVDLRNIYNPADMKAAGFSYVSVGRQ